MMKKLPLLTALCSLLGLGAASLQATPYWDNDLLLDKLTNGQSLTGTFDIATGDGDFGDRAGFNGGTEVLASAFATFTFLDLNRAQTTVEIDLGTQTFRDITAFVLPFFVSGEILGQALVDLGDDGVISYMITNAGRTPFTVVSASLNAFSVPDGGTTLGLLGLGFVITALAGRRSRGPRLAN